MTLSEFLNRYPEFDQPDGDSTLAKAALDETEGRLDAAVFGQRFDEAHGALAAHELWSSAFGVSLRQDGAEGKKSKYLEHFESVQKAISVPLTMMVI